MSLSDDLFGPKASLSLADIERYQKPTQSLVSEQLDISRQLMDPESMINMQQRNIMTQRAAETGEQVTSGAARLGAQMGMSPGQLLMQQRMGMNQAMGGVNQQWQQGLQSNFGSGMGLMGNMTQQQQGLDENMANAYIQKIAEKNARRQQNFSNFMGLAGLAVGGWGAALKAKGGSSNGDSGGGSGSDSSSDIALKENIELVGKSPKGLNIYEFDYKDKSYGKGRYRGVMAQEVPNASFKHHDGYLWVNYNKLDVNFERIS